MPTEQPGARISLIATKATSHGAPAVEKNHPGVAAKSGQASPAYPSEANALLAKNIAIGEEFVIMLAGAHHVDVDLLPDGAVVGDPVYITVADNALADAAEAITAGLVESAYRKFGRISEIDTASGLALVNLNLRDTL